MIHEVTVQAGACAPAVAHDGLAGEGAPKLRHKNTVLVTMALLPGAAALGVTVDEARKEFSKVLGRVAYGKEWIPLTRRGKLIAIMVPKSDVERVSVLAKSDPSYRVTSVEARNNFSEVVSRAGYGTEPVIITLRGEVVACIVSVGYVKRLSQYNNTPGEGTRSWKSILKEKYGETTRPTEIKSKHSYEKDLS